MSEINTDAFRRNFLKTVIVLVVLASFIYILAPFCVPVILGGILAMAFSPFLCILRKLKLGRRISLLMMTFILFFMCIAPAVFIIVRGTKVVSNFLSQQSLVETKKVIEQKIYIFLDHFAEKSNFDPVSIREKFDSFMNSVGAYALKLFSSLVSQIPDLFLLVLITSLAFYFFLLDEEKIRSWFDQYFYFTRENGDRFISLVKTSCKEVFISNVLIGIIQASTISAGAFFCKTGDFFITFFITFFLSFIPIGASPVGFLLALSAFLDHRVGAAIAMAIVTGFSVVIDNIVRPYLNSKGIVEVPLFVNILAIIGGVVSMGLAGLFVGPLLASLTYGALPIILDEWFPPPPKNP